ncbi:hypothetical protein D3C75_871750 [compost metagenome]
MSIIVNLRGFLQLEDFRTEVGHFDLSDILEGMRCIGIALVHNIRIAGFQLDHGDFGQHVPCIHCFLLLHTRVGQQLIVHVIQIHIIKMSPVSLVHSVWGKYMQRFVVLGQLIEAVRNDQADGQGFQPCFLVGVNFLAVEEFQNIPAKNIVVGCSGAFTLAHLIRIGEAVLHQFEHRHNALRRILDTLDCLPA